MTALAKSPARMRLHFILRPLRTGAAVLFLAAGGAVLAPVAGSLRQQELAAGLQHEMPDIDRSDALSQQLALFTLGGLRSLAAEILSLDATNAWVERDWARAERRWQAITTLAPKRVNYWVSAARDMGTNASADSSANPRFSTVEQARLAASYYERGLRFLKDGIRNNPDSILLYCRLGDMHSDLYRRPRFGEAAEAYHRAVEMGAPDLYARQEFYNLCRIRGREKEAYALGRKLFEKRDNRVPSVSCLLFVLQHILALPEDECLGVTELFGTPARARKTLASYEHNHLRFPTAGIRGFLSRP